MFSQKQEPKPRKTMPLPKRDSKFIDTPYKVSLFVDILGRREIDGATHYRIVVTKNQGTKGQVSHEVFRRYNAFHEQLFSKLEDRGFLSLPDYPKKKFNPFMSEKDKM